MPSMNAYSTLDTPDTRVVARATSLTLPIDTSLSPVAAKQCTELQAPRKGEWASPTQFGFLPSRNGPNGPFGPEGRFSAGLGPFLRAVLVWVGE